MELQAGNREVLRERVSRDGFSESQIDQFLRSIGLTRAHADIGLRLAPQQVYRRTFFVPRQASELIEQLAVRELSMRTPFRVGDIHHGYTAVEDGDRIAIWQWVVRRDLIEKITAEVSLNAELLDFVDENEATAGSGPNASIRLRRSSTEEKWLKTSIAVLICASAVLLVTWCGLVYWRQASAMEKLNSQLATVRIEARKVQLSVDQYEAKRKILDGLRAHKKDTAPFVDVLEEIARVLPMHTWVTEVRLTTSQEGRTIALAGFSEAAPSLVGIINSSSLLDDAALTAPVSMDATEGRARFAIQAKVITETSSTTEQKK
jgi:general secretion pathway protein L